MVCGVDPVKRENVQENSFQWEKLRLAIEILFLKN